jgi:hypothetical protein
MALGMLAEEMAHSPFSHLTRLVARESLINHCKKLFFILF